MTNYILSGNKLLGKGTFGEVFTHGRDPSLAVKRSEKDMRNEYGIGRRLNHKNLLKMHALFIKKNPKEDREIHQLVMDKIEGTELSACVGDKRIPTKTVESLFIQAKDCCSYLYDQGIYWHDLNAGNLYIIDQGQLLIADFGDWKAEENIQLRGLALLMGFSNLICTLLKGSNMSEENQVELIALINKKKPTFSALIKKDKAEIRQMLQDFGEFVLAEFRKIT
jgi:serine/threonine protein kinase